MSQHTDEYIPGKCNIGPVEIKRRYRIGYQGLALMVLFIFFAEYFRIPREYKLFFFVPAFYSLSGFLQAWQKFCFVYGWQGLFSMAGRKSFSKTKQESLHLDRSKAMHIVSRVTLGSSIATLLYYLLS